MTACKSPALLRCPCGTLQTPEPWQPTPEPWQLDEAGQFGALHCPMCGRAGYLSLQGQFDTGWNEAIADEIVKERRRP